MVGPHVIDRGQSTAFRGLVDDVIVDERGVVQHLKCGGSLQRLVIDSAKELGAE